MIAIVQTSLHRSAAAGCRERFLQLSSQVRKQARFAFRQFSFEHRQELIAEVVANAFVAFLRLVDRGLDDIIYPTPLAQYAIKQVRDGRRVGSSLNVRDVSSDYAQRVKEFRLGRLDRYDEALGQWREVLIEDRKAGPADTAAARIDFGNWLRSLPRYKRRIAVTLARGETTTATARKYRLSPGRISQLRRELAASWNAFQGETASS